MACIDTGATFSLMSDRAYEQVSEHLPGLLPAPVSLSGAGGESLGVKGAVSLEFKLGEGLYD